MLVLAWAAVCALLLGERRIGIVGLGSASWALQERSTGRRGLPWADNA